MAYRHPQFTAIATPTNNEVARALNNSYRQGESWAFEIQVSKRD